MDRDPAATRTQVVTVGGKERLVVEAPVLLVEEGPDAGRELEVPQHPVVVGRGEAADFRIEDPLVSREHLRIEPTGAGFRLRDLESKSGVYLGEARITEAELPLDVPFRIGKTVLVLRGSRRELPLPRRSRLEFQDMVGRCTAMQRLFGLVERLASVDLPVLVLGETGTGKELVARALWRCGPLADAPYRVVDCTLLADENQARSELFGHVKGAFTGADQERRGAFREAHGGTLFLDEVGELPPAIQPLLLRALQEGEVRALGADQVSRVRVRVLAATHRDLAARVEEGAFRRDLYHRLASVVLTVPPLRERGDDLELLARRFLPKDVDLAPSAWAALEACDWPGNVRELEQALRRAAALRRGHQVTAQDLGIQGGSGAGEQQGRFVAPSTEELALDPERVLETPRSRLARITDEDVLEALQRADGNRKQAAKLLGISPASLYRRLRKMRPAQE